MTQRNKWVMAAGLTIGLALMIMIAIHFYGSYSYFGEHPMHLMWASMGWSMLFAPVAMLLFFGGLIALLVALFR